MDYRIPNSEIEKLNKRLSMSPKQMLDVAVYMVQLVEDRFRSQGASGGNPWKPKRIKEWGADDGRAILTGRSGVMRKSFTGIANDKQAIVGSWAPYSVVHQRGTRSKGGDLPDIVPKKAKMLFIPLNDRAANSIRFIGKEASAMRTLHKLPGLATAYRAGVKESRRNRTVSFVKLVKGRLKDGKLQGFNEKTGEWSSNLKPDFLFLKRVSIPARGMLPTSPQEIKKIAQFFVERLMRD